MPFNVCTTMKSNESETAMSQKSRVALQAWHGRECIFLALIRVPVCRHIASAIHRAFAVQLLCRSAGKVRVLLGSCKEADGALCMHAQVCEEQHDNSGGCGSCGDRCAACAVTVERKFACRANQSISFLIAGYHVVIRSMHAFFWDFADSLLRGLQG